MFMSKCCMDLGEECEALRTKEEGCGSKQCSFFKPAGCKKWVRFQDDGIEYIAPPESRKIRSEWIEL